MIHERRWDPCIAHRGDQVDKFLDHYLAQPDRSVLLVAGAGFDPRSCAVAARLSKVATCVRYSSGNSAPIRRRINRIELSKTQIVC